MNNSSKVQEQYKTSGNLATRISIHDKYSVNKMGFGNWIFSHYGDLSGLRVLELGCGNGAMWMGKGRIVDQMNELYLTDFSEGMLRSAFVNVGKHNKIRYKIIDIQDIPYEDNSFDVVIANMMLYHVPEIHKGLREVRRVLKKSGKFFAATYGEHGISEYIASRLRFGCFKELANKNFTLQKGDGILSPYFTSVKRYDYEDELRITKAEDFADYILSMTVLSRADMSREQLINILKIQIENGVIRVPKEYGMFVCEK